MAPAKGGNILTRKFGPLPGWAWAGIGVGAYLVYKQRKAASAAAGAAPATTSTAAVSPGALSPCGYGYQCPSGGWGGPGWIVGTPTGSTANASAATPWSPPTNEQYGGAGYGLPGGSGVVTSASGQQFSELMPGSTVPGGQYYYQPSPGIFQPIPQGTNIQGAPYFIPVGASA